MNGKVNLKIGSRQASVQSPVLKLITGFKLSQRKISKFFGLVQNFLIWSCPSAYFAFIGFLQW